MRRRRRVWVITACVLAVGFLAMLYLGGQAMIERLDSDPQPQELAELAGTAWTAVEIAAADEKLELTDRAGQQVPGVAFTEDGQVGWTDGCNGHSASYEVIGEQLILVGVGASTQVKCLDRERLREAVSAVMTLGQPIDARLTSETLLLSLDNYEMRFVPR